MCIGSNMALIQHSSNSNAWGTPIDIIERARVVLGGIDLDPASDVDFNHNVKALYFITKEENGLRKPWPSECSVFLNPPGGKTGRDSNMVLFWDCLMRYSRSLNDSYRCNLKHAIFVAFSLEALQTTQQCETPIAHFPMCFPKKRLRFIDENCREGSAPSHGNVIVYVPGSVNYTRSFKEVFAPVGCVVVPS